MKEKEFVYILLQECKNRDLIKLGYSKDVQNRLSQYFIILFFKFYT